MGGCDRWRLPRFRQQRAVEELYDRCDGAEDGEHFGIEPSACRQLRVEFAAGEKLFEAQVMFGRMILRVAAWNARQLLAFEAADGAPKGRRRDEAVKGAVAR